MGRKKKVAKKDKAVFRLVNNPSAGGSNRVLVPVNDTAYRQYDEIYQENFEDEENEGLPLPEDCDEDFIDDEAFEGEFDGDKESEGDEEGKEKERKRIGKGKGKEKEVEDLKSRGLSFNYDAHDYEFGHLGIGMGDGYDYSKHMKPAGTGDVYIPAPKPRAYKKPLGGRNDTVSFLKEDKDEKASMTQGDTKPLHLQNSKPYLDKDILRYLEEEEEVTDSEFEGFDGELEDDFVALCEGGEDAEFGEFSGIPRRTGLDPNFVPDPEDLYDDEDEDFDDDGPPDLEAYEDEHNRTVDPVMMSERQQDLEEQFQHVLEMYDEEEIGELDPEDPRLQGKKEIDQFQNVLEEHIETTGRQIRFGLGALDEEENDQEKEQLASRLRSLNLPKETVKMALQGSGIGQQWDCQSITSLYSNTENHPTLIDEPKQIKLSSKTGIPLGYLGQHAAKRKVEEESDEEDSDDEYDDDDRVNLGEKRPKKENADDKRMRKQVAKKAKQEARMRKKETKQEFSREKTRQMSAQAKNSLGQHAQIRM